MNERKGLLLADRWVTLKVKPAAMTRSVRCGVTERTWARRTPAEEVANIESFHAGSQPAMKRRNPR